MPSDLELIKQLEKQIGKKFKKKVQIQPGIAPLGRPEYEIDSNDDVIRMNLRKLGLRKVPLAITKFKKLTHLSLSDNQLNTLPPEIAQLPNLEYLTLWQNPLKQPLRKLQSLKTT